MAAERDCGGEAGPQPVSRLAAQLGRVGLDGEWEGYMRSIAAAAGGPRDARGAVEEVLSEVLTASDLSQLGGLVDSILASPEEADAAGTGPEETAVVAGPGSPAAPEAPHAAPGASHGGRAGNASSAQSATAAARLSACAASFTPTGSFNPATPSFAPAGVSPELGPSAVAAIPPHFNNVTSEAEQPGHRLQAGGFPGDPFVDDSHAGFAAPASPPLPVDAGEAALLRDTLSSLARHPPQSMEPLLGLEGDALADALLLLTGLSEQEEEEGPPPEPCKWVLEHAHRRTRGGLYALRVRGRCCPDRGVTPHCCCRYYMQGACFRRDCWFSHDLSKVPCTFFARGFCSKGDECPFQHDRTRENMNAILPNVIHAILHGLLPPGGHLSGADDVQAPEDGAPLSQEHFPALGGQPAASPSTVVGPATQHSGSIASSRSGAVLSLASRLKLAQLTESFTELWPEDVESAFRACGCRGEATVAALKQANPGTTYV